MSEPYYPPLSPLSTGLSCTCPRCGKASLFEGFLKVRETCPNCGLDLKNEDSGDGPAVFIIFVLGGTVVPLALWIETLFEPPLWVHAVLWSGAVLGGTVALLRPLKAYTIALQFKHKTPHRPPGS